MAYTNRWQQQASTLHEKNLKTIATTSQASASDSDIVYKPVSPDANFHAELDGLHSTDQKLKRRIRRLKFISRIVAVVVSLATLIPLIITVVKFIQTKDTYYNVNGLQRTAWSEHTTTWYTWTYLGVSLMSFIVNVAVVIAYFASVNRANAVATIAGWWAGVVIALHIVAWIVSVVLYKVGSLPNSNAKFTDLWGWTCSNAAKTIQPLIKDVDYNQYCMLQTGSFYIGIIAAISSVLSMVVYIFALIRSRSKKRVARHHARRLDLDKEPLRRSDFQA